MQIREFHRNHKTKINKAEMEETIKKLRKEREKLVKGRFEFIDAQGGWLAFNYRYFPGDPILHIRINHGEVVDLPLGIVKDLNNTVKKVRKLNTEALKTADRVAPFDYEIQSRIRFTPLEVLI